MAGDERAAKRRGLPTTISGAAWAPRPGAKRSTLAPPQTLLVAAPPLPRRPQALTELRAAEPPPSPSEGCGVLRRSSPLKELGRHSSGGGFLLLGPCEATMNGPPRVCKCLHLSF